MFAEGRKLKVSSKTADNCLKNRGRAALRDASRPDRRTRKGEPEHPANSNPAFCSDVSACTCMMDPSMVGPVGARGSESLRGVEPLRQLTGVDKSQSLV